MVSIFPRFLRKQIVYIKRSLSTRKRKYPINPEDTLNLPIFEYGVSKKSYNRIFVWGNTKSGALGIPYIKSSESYDVIKDFHRPKRLGFGEKNEVKQIACGFGYTLFSINSEDSDELYGTGLNTDSQIGYHDIRKNKPLELIFYPKHISLPWKNVSNIKILKISAGRAHSLVLTNDGLFCLGNNAYGQCGRPCIKDEDYSISNYIHRIEKLDGNKIVDIECGQDHSLALTEDGSVYSCGWGADGQTGLGSFENCHSFSKVGGDISTEKIVKLNSRCDFVMALNDNGEVFGWGNTEYAQITLSDGKQQICSPTYMKMLNKLGKIIDIGAGGSFCLVLNENREVFSWGFGILGFGPNVQHSVEPMKIPEVLFGKNDFQPNNMVERIACGVSHAFAITSLGDLYAWGRNRNGCLGLGDEHDQFFPIKVCLGGTVNNVHCGIDHTVAICKPFI
ncbi:hypothetical protein WA026_008821 [Henosepilachna vigintioctopunctata]|uniref:RCC1-like G exchanging factor-like protein n=1 Tax=Henosepilachna vigintioctopunctata TaxID=420089 RepID=A0AAW1VCI2_9CUCU